ncbi:hypothetical protein SAMN05216232_3721 [Virgibacillus subterraneus]|uniref:Uncharacterized protein n=2 Tax=Virgibacillus TaxID=84406 RepID=A0A1H1DJC0_9BACI|nr:MULTISPECIES: hypothetical protein [Virgibacillus]SDQ76298.1 hypothetical protein SAMN05216231_2434 [Virgibacillus salinus]SEQ92334.1 hypothetical protein SAMN05216232_3721 [Virgibacillus subterraneus]
MSSKIVVIIIVALTLIILIFGWFFLKDVIVKFDIDQDTSQQEIHLDTFSTEKIFKPKSELKFTSGLF